MNNPIRTEAHNYQALRQRLVAEFPDIDDETLHDTLEGLSDLEEMLAALISSYLDDRYSATALDQRVKDMQERLSRYQARAEKKKELAREVMEFAGVRKLRRPEFTVSLSRRAPGLVVRDEGAVPAAYWVPQPPRLDRQKLKQALKEGQQVSGAMLDNGGVSVAVRVK